MKHFLMTGALAALLAGLSACDDFSLFSDSAREPGELRWVLDRGSLTKAAESMPDTNDFILSVSNASGSILYEGPYGDSPQFLQVEAGSYTLRIVSAPFTEPAFSAPQYGDTQLVVVPAGQSITARLNCTLLNAGIRLRTGSDFLSAFPDGILYVKQGNARLKYLYRETRTAYVNEGDVSVLLQQENQGKTLFTRHLAAREILTVNLSVPEGNAGGISVQTDTSKIWEEEDFVIGGPARPGEAVSVSEASRYIGGEEIWVCAYIVGGDLSSTGNSIKTSQISKSTHLALADRSSVSDKASCLAVELPAGKIRNQLNLVDHPELIGSRVSVKGKIVEKYFGTLGMKGTSDCQLP